MADIDDSLDNRITLKTLSRALSHGLSPIVEVESMDGIYTVRFHHANGISELCDNNGATRTFLGTGEIREMLGDLGLTHGVLTWADQCGDEMIGVEGHAMTPEEMLANGTRISFR
ncbi:hypothetical protein [Halomonas cupida]|nr:hypothetical protein [Halomonas cupida]SHM08924.1 hypothetical protein SAMN05660971_02112 [Halomonas cupida]